MIKGGEESGGDFGLIHLTNTILALRVISGLGEWHQRLLLDLNQRSARKQSRGVACAGTQLQKKKKKRKKTPKT